FVAQVFINLNWPYIRERNAHIFGLPARIAPIHMRVPEQTGTGISVHAIRDASIRICVVTMRPQSPLAEKTSATCNREWNNDPIANREIFHLRADFNDLTHEFVAKNIAGLHSRDESVIELQI